MDMPTCHITG